MAHCILYIKLNKVSYIISYMLFKIPNIINKILNIGIYKIFETIEYKKYLI